MYKGKREESLVVDPSSDTLVDVFVCVRSKQDLSVMVMSFL
jgi:hypothetical protein